MRIPTKNGSLPFYLTKKSWHAKKKDTVHSVFFSGGMWLTFTVERRANDN